MREKDNDTNPRWHFGERLLINIESPDTSPVMRTVLDAVVVNKKHVADEYFQYTIAIKNNNDATI
jgi:hypothetical protein